MPTQSSGTVYLQALTPSAIYGAKRKLICIVPMQCHNVAFALRCWSLRSSFCLMQQRPQSKAEKDDLKQDTLDLMQENTIKSFAYQTRRISSVFNMPINRCVILGGTKDQILRRHAPPSPSGGPSCGRQTTWPPAVGTLSLSLSVPRRCVRLSSGGEPGRQRRVSGRVVCERRHSCAVRVLPRPSARL